MSQTSHLPLRTTAVPREQISQTNVSMALAKTLKAAGVTQVFGQCCPIAFFLACESEGITQIGYRTENAGTIMADGFARASGRVAVIAAQNGPAAALVVPGLAEALKASVPVVAIVQDVARTHMDRNAFQELDHEGMFRPVCKWVRRVPMGERAAEYLQRAIRAATTGRPGPAVLIVPWDMTTEEIGAWTPPASLTPDIGRLPVDRFVPARENLTRAVRTLMAAQRPLIVAGGGVHLSGASEALARLQQAWQIPVATTNMGKGTVDESHPLSIGVAGYVMGSLSPTHHLRDYVRGADAVLFIGSRTNENGTASWTLFNPHAQFIQADVDPEEIGRNYEGQRLLGDARATLEALLDEGARLEVGPHAGGPAVRELIARARRAYEASIAPHAGSSALPLRPERLMHELDARAGAEVIWVADASYSSLWVSQYARSRRAGQRFITPRGLGGLGWGLPLAIGAKIARPDLPVIAVVGDGGFAHCWSELETARRHGVPVIVVVLNNSVLGFQRDAELNRFGTFADVCAIGPFDHVAIARACGCEGAALHDPADIAAVWEQALASKLPFVIDAFVDPAAFPPITAFEKLHGAVDPSAALVTEAAPSH